MTIQQTVEIPASRRLTIEVPREVPLGRVVLTFTPKPKSIEQEKPVKSATPHADFLSGILDRSTTPVTDRLAGVAAHLGEKSAKSVTPITDFLSGLCASAGDITLEQIREERLVNKYLK